MFTRQLRVVCLVTKRRFHNLLVSTQWVDEQLTAQNEEIRLVHASFVECVDYKRAHIPTAVCFSGTVCRDMTSPYNNIFPTPENFEKYVNDKLVISKDDHIVVYDDDQVTPNLSAGARVWFMFLYFGHKKVSLLDGGLYKWFNEGRPIGQNLGSNNKTKEKLKLLMAREKRHNDKGKFVVKPQANLMVFYEEMVKNVTNKESQVVDARIPKRFLGQAEPLGKPGRIPNAINTPLASFIDPSSKTLLSKDKLEELFKKSGVDLKKPLIAYCGSGVTACAPIFAAHLCGKLDSRLYNGSWCEWNQRASDDLIVKR